MALHSYKKKQQQLLQFLKKVRVVPKPRDTHEEKPGILSKQRFTRKGEFKAFDEEKTNAIFFFAKCEDET